MDLLWSGGRTASRSECTRAAAAAAAAIYVNAADVAIALPCACWTSEQLATELSPSWGEGAAAPHVRALCLGVPSRLMSCQVSAHQLP